MLDTDAVTKCLAKSVTFRTICHQDHAEFNPKPFRAFQQFLNKTYPLAHKNLDFELVNEHALLYTWTGSDTKLKPILILAHYDVVPVEPGTEGKWIKDAYSEIIEDGFVWGRGTLDDKVNVLATMEAVEILLAEGKQPARTVMLAYGHDEEIGGDGGAAKISELLKSRNISVEFALDEGGVLATGLMLGISAPVATIGIAEKGYVSIKLLVEAAGDHSSQPPKATAVGIMAKAIH